MARPTEYSAHPETYFARSREPLQALIFLAPLLILYEVGTFFYATDQVTGTRETIKAWSQLARLYDLFGISFYALPGILVVILLLSLHLIAKDRWTFNGWIYFGMAVEAALLAFPILILAMMMLGRPSAGGGRWEAELVFSVGAGIYEELLFRLILISLLHLLLVDLLPFKDPAGALLAVLLSAVAFAAYHFSSYQEIEWDRFIFFTLAGLYLASIYLLRGFGIVVGAHAIYDVIVVLIGHGFLTLR